MREAAKRSNSRFLISQCSRTAATMLRGLNIEERTARTTRPDNENATPIDGIEIPHTPMRGFTRSRARSVLKRAMDEAGASSAHLYVLGPEGATLTASAGDVEPPEEIASEAWSLGHGETAEAAPAKPLIRTVNALERSYELMLLPRSNAQAKATVLALEHDSSRGGADLPASVLEKLVAWSAD
jgi:hypothetical protein